VGGDGGLKSKDKKNSLPHDVNSSGWDPDMDAAELIPLLNCRRSPQCYPAALFAFLS
jgi:hypothetical protein